MATQIKFTQTADGAFSFNVIPNTPHCGPSDSIIQSVRYRVSVTYGLNPLDSDGFLLDNTWFSQYFGGWLKSTPIGFSCELLAVRVAEDILRETAGRGTGVVVSLSAIPDVWIVADVSVAA
jgi:hypothetical protein